MNQGQFDRQIQRLVSNFGRTAYSPERAILIWKEVSNLSSEWLENTVDRFIGEFRQAPLIQDFREAIAEERERIWKTEKRQHEKDAKDFWESSYHSDEIATICQTIRARMNGNLSDSDYSNFQAMLKDVSKSAPKVAYLATCSRCDGSGIIFNKVDGYEYVYRCRCHTGRNRKEPYPVISDSIAKAQ